MVQNVPLSVFVVADYEDAPTGVASLTSGGSLSSTSGSSVFERQGVTRTKGHLRALHSIGALLPQPATGYAKSYRS
ncbi:unnamed protein product, partial [Amoebophrya sp. A25]|eukprot:GSA25T00024657001.1